MAREFRFTSARTGLNAHELKITPLHFLVAQFALACSAIAADRDWPVYLGDAGASHYSTLRQIDRSNVRRLARAWTYQAGHPTPTSQIQCNPLIVDGVLYGTSPRLKRTFHCDRFRSAGTLVSS
jgi:quinoprotein glucose dehydrogenase